MQIINLYVNNVKRMAFIPLRRLTLKAIRRLLDGYSKVIRSTIYTVLKGDFSVEAVSTLVSEGAMDERHYVLLDNHNRGITESVATQGLFIHAFHHTYAIFFQIHFYFCIA